MERDAKKQRKWCVSCLSLRVKSLIRHLMRPTHPLSVTGTVQSEDLSSLHEC